MKTNTISYVKLCLLAIFTQLPHSLLCFAADPIPHFSMIDVRDVKVNLLYTCYSESESFWDTQIRGKRITPNNGYLSLSQGEKLNVIIDSAVKDTEIHLPAQLASVVSALSVERFSRVQTINYGVLENLERIKIYGGSFADADVSLLAPCGKLIHIDISSSYISDNTIKLLAAQHSLKSLLLNGSNTFIGKSLNQLNRDGSLEFISFEEMSQFDPRTLSLIKAPSSLKGISLHGCNLSPHDLSHFMQFSNLEYLSLGCRELQIDSQLVDFLRSFKSLRSVKIFGKVKEHESPLRPPILGNAMKRRDDDIKWLKAQLPNLNVAFYYLDKTNR